MPRTVFKLKRMREGMETIVLGGVDREGSWRVRGRRPSWSGNPIFKADPRLAYEVFQLSCIIIFLKII